MKHDVDLLIASIRACNEKLYACSESWKEQQDKHEDDVSALLAVELVKQRAVLLQQLSAIMPLLNQLQINRIAQLFQTMLESDKAYMLQVQTQQSEIKGALSAIGNGKKALQLYQIHSR